MFSQSVPCANSRIIHAASVIGNETFHFQKPLPFPAIDGVLVVPNEVRN
jgi:hypothetical protein